jgi:leader peptidase (prepilin peptidase) / N-methyltransferase
MSWKMKWNENLKQMKKMIFDFVWKIGGYVLIILSVMLQLASDAANGLLSKGLDAGLSIGLLVAGLIVLFLASFMGVLAALPVLMRKSLKAGSRLPFGPFLLAATVVVYLSGQDMIDWYLSVFL